MLDRVDGSGRDKMGGPRTRPGAAVERSCCSASGDNPTVGEDEADLGVLVDASMMFAGSVMVIPTPTAEPLMAAMTGLVQL